MLIARVVNRNRQTVTWNRSTRWMIAECLIVLAIGVAAISAQAAEDHTATVAGRVLDPLGGAIAHAKVTLIRDDQPVTDATSDESGRFTVASNEAGRYQVHVEVAGNGSHLRGRW